MLNVIVPLGKNTKLRIHYEDKLKMFDLNMIFVNYDDTWDEHSDSVKRAYNESVGVLLVGGEDIEPKTYASSYKHPTVTTTDLGREQTERAMLEKAYVDKKPILAICRGAQMMAVYSGLQLNQHVPDFLDTSIERHTSHKEEVPKTLDSLTPNEILIAKESRLGQIIGQETAEVKCAHHQSISYKLDSRLKLSAISRKGLPEAWEGQDPKHFEIGVQFHPELGSGLTDLIFAAYKDACQEYRLGK